MQYKVRTFVIPARVNKVAEEVEFEVAGAASDGIEITFTDVDGDDIVMKFDSSESEVSVQAGVVILPSADAPSQAVRTQRIVEQLSARIAAQDIQLSVSKVSDTKISLKQLKGGDVITIALANGAAGTITEVVAGTNGDANGDYGSDLELNPSNLGFNPASSGMSKVQVSCLDFGGTFSLSFRPVGTQDFLPFADPVAGGNADAGDDIFVLGRQDDPIFDAIKIGFAGTNGSDITVYATFFER